MKTSTMIKVKVRNIFANICQKNN